MTRFLFLLISKSSIGQTILTMSFQVKRDSLDFVVPYPTQKGGGGMFLRFVQSNSLDTQLQWKYFICLNSRLQKIYRTFNHMLHKIAYKISSKIPKSLRHVHAIVLLRDFYPFVKIALVPDLNGKKIQRLRMATTA